MVRGRRFFSLVLIFLVVFMAGFAGEAAGYIITGTVFEKYTNNPLAGAVVVLGEQSMITDALGRFALTDVPEGEQLIQVELEGYLPISRQLDITADLAVELDMVSPLPPMNNRGFHFTARDGSILRDGESVAEPGAKILYYVRYLFDDPDVVEVDSVMGVLNGHLVASQHYDEFWVGAVGLPLEPGSNTVQLRVWDSEGWARTSKLMIINCDVERLDMRLLLSWDQDADLDLHLFKRDNTEPNIFDHGTEDRHLSYWGYMAEDFGEGPAQNPVLDWDGYGAFGWDGIYFQEMTPGDYHIWVYPWSINEGFTQAVVRVILDMIEPCRAEATYELDLGEEAEAQPFYIITVRVHEDGRKELLYKEPEIAGVAEG